MVPTKDTEPAVSMLTRRRDIKRKRPTLTPKVRALSSPNRSAVSFQAEASEKGKITSMMMLKKRMFSQLALDREPRLQKINCCRASALAMYWRMPMKALKVKTKAIPKRTNPSGPDPRREERV